MSMDRNNRQRWTAGNVVRYTFYRVFAKHIPDDFPIIGPRAHVLRRLVCRPLLRETARHIGISEGVDFGHGHRLIMRDHANLGKNCSISGKGIVTVGCHVMMGCDCVIITQNHRYLEEGYGDYIVKDVLIDDHAWIGHRVIILPGVSIGKHAVVGAGAVVSRSVPDYGIAVGNPARVVKYRKDTGQAVSRP